MTSSSRAPRLRFLSLIPATAILIFASQTLHAQKTPKNAPAPAPAATTPATPDRAAAYYHYGLAHLYEDLAVNAGRSDYATQAVEEYKLALTADPNSALV